MLKETNEITDRTIIYYFLFGVLFTIGEILAAFGYWMADQKIVDIDPSRLFIIISCTSMLVSFSILIGARLYSSAISLALELTNNLRTKNQRLQELEEFQSDFFSMVTHQLKTPITAIRWNIESIETKELGKEGKEILEEIIAQTDNLSDLTKILLNISRINSDRMSINSKNEQINMIIEESLDEMEPIAKEKQIEIVSRLDTIESSVDKSMLSNMFNNLLSNAIKYSSNKTKVEVELVKLNDHFEITIQDYGIGIPEEEQDKIFKKFFRAGNTTDTSGTGLGLYLVKLLADLTGGELSFTSKVGEGSIFKIKYPMKGMPEKKGEISFGN